MKWIADNFLSILYSIGVLCFLFIMYMSIRYGDNRPDDGDVHDPR